MKYPMQLDVDGYSLEKENLQYSPTKISLFDLDTGETTQGLEILKNPKKFHDTELNYGGNTTILIKIKDRRNALLLTKYRYDGIPSPEHCANYNILMSSEGAPGASIISNLDQIEQSMESMVTVADGLAIKGEYTLFVGFKQIGLTLCLLKAVANQITKGEIKAENVIYMTGNASKKGYVDIAKKLKSIRIEDVYVDGVNGFNMRLKFFKIMKHYVDIGEADQTTIIVDMLKNVCDMSKPSTIIEFNESIRKFTIEGGTVLINASPNKVSAPDGSPVPPGFNDVIEGCNSLFLATKEVDNNTVTVKYENESGAIKDKEVYWQYKEKCSNYSEVFDSVIRVSSEDVKNNKGKDMELAQIQNDLENIIKTVSIIKDGINTKTKLTQEVVKQCKLSRPKAEKLLERYIGKYWKLSEVGHNNAKVYTSSCSESGIRFTARINLNQPSNVFLDQDDIAA